MPTTPLLLFVTLNGVNYPLASCRWVRFAPNGCALGSHHGDAFTNPTAAATYWTTNQRDRDREQRRGVRYRLLTPQQWQTVKPCLTGECRHTQAA
jgi:hypothetical protein